jgi:hypothetical protein
MLIQLRRSVVAAFVALLALFVAHWFDAGVLVDAQRRAGTTFDPSALFYLTPVAHLLTAAGVVALALAAWRSRSLLVGVGYAIVGGFLVLLPATVWAFATSVNGAPTPAPEPIATALANWYFTVAAGLTGAVFTLAGAMLLSGLAVIASTLRAQRPGPAAASPATAQAPQSEPA